MKKIENVLVVSILCLTAFVAGYCNGSENSRNQERLTKSLEVALDKAEVVIDNNNLYDTDGSDAMSEYMEAQKKVYALYNK